MLFQLFLAVFHAVAALENEVQFIKDLAPYAGNTTDDCSDYTVDDLQSCAYLMLCRVNCISNVQYKFTNGHITFLFVLPFRSPSLSL